MTSSEGKRAIVWFREDLRLLDNPSLVKASRSSDEILPVYIFNEDVFRGRTRWYGFPKVGKFRAQFIIESVTNLRENLRKRGSDLVIRVGSPDKVMAELVRQYQVQRVFCMKQHTQEEVNVESAVASCIQTLGSTLEMTSGVDFLYEENDLPFPVEKIPDVFTSFRNAVEKKFLIRHPLNIPEPLKPTFASLTNFGEIPSLVDLTGLDPVQFDERSALEFIGGEDHGLERIRHYFWDTDAVASYFETRNGMIGPDFSTKFAPWLAQGCISPRTIYSELTKYETQRTKNKSTYWIAFELLTRDFFKYMGRKHGNRIFLREGYANGSGSGVARKVWKKNPRNFQRWMDGTTGTPLVDANMRELNCSGFMSNRGRQNVASFLIHDLEINWKMGAEYFESVLIDYDVAVNWCNWAYLAGVGSDPRPNRYFNILTQAAKYDPDGSYVKHWLNELDAVPNSHVHRPDTLSREEQRHANITLGVNFPIPIVPSRKWMRRR